MNQDRFWIATNKDRCYIFCSIDDEVLFKNLAEPVFNEISGPYKNELMQEITDNLNKQYAVNQISLEYENWIELLNELNESIETKLAKEHDIEIDDYFVIKINNEKYKLFKGSWAKALQKCRELKLLNGNNDECSILHGQMSKKDALDALSVYRVCALKHANINTYWIIRKNEKYELYYGSLNKIENMKNQGYEIWKDSPFTEDGANSELSRLNMKS